MKEKTIRQWATECYSPEELKNFFNWFDGNFTKFGKDYKVHIVGIDELVSEWTFQAYWDDFERWCEYSK